MLWADFHEIFGNGWIMVSRCKIFKSATDCKYLVVYLEEGLNRCLSYYVSSHLLTYVPLPRTNTDLARSAYSVVAPSICNALPAELRLCHSTATFNRHLKTHLFHLN